MVVFGQSGFIRAKVVVVGQSGIIFAKVVAFQQRVFLGQKWLYSGEVVEFWAKVAVFGNKWLY